MWKWKIKAVFILLLTSCIIKLWVWYRTPVVNPDAFEYIEQAKLLYKGSLSQAKNCGKHYLSLYHFLIPIAYKIFKEWIFSARAVSFFFAVITTIPVFFSFLLICNPAAAFVSSFLFSVNPFLSRLSSEIIKDQMFWFFLNLGLLLSIYWLKRNRNLVFFLLSFLSFLCSSLIRIEGLLFAIFSPVFLLYLSKKKKLIYIYLLLILAFVLTVFLFVPDIQKIYLSKRLGLIYFIKKFNLKRLFIDIGPHILGGILYVFSIPYFVLLIIGIKKEQFLHKIEFKYLLSLSVLSISFLLIFFGSLCYSKRYLAIFFFPSFFFIGPCISNIIERLESILNNKRSAIVFLCIFIFFSSIIYNLKQRRAHAIMYKKAGQYIAKIQHGKFSTILAYNRRINLYANERSLKTYCKGRLLENISIFDLGQKKALEYLCKNHIQFVFWESDKWKIGLDSFSFLTLIKEWPRNGKIFRLYKVKLELCHKK